MTKKFNVTELTIQELHKSIRKGQITCKDIVEIYLDRIDRLDISTGLNSMVVINQNAVKTANELDKEFAESGKLRSLHGVPAIIKKEFLTKDAGTF